MTGRMSVEEFVAWSLVLEEPERWSCTTDDLRGGRVPSGPMGCSRRRSWDSVVLPDLVAVVKVPRADGGAEYWSPRLRAYLALSTVRHVVAVHAAVRTALHLRCAADGAMAGRVLRGGAVELAPPGVALDLDRAWARLDRRGDRGDRV